LTRSEDIVLVTGASGAIGAHVVTTLLERDWRVRALVHRGAGSEAVEAVHGDLLNPATLDAAVVGATNVIHLAAVTHTRSPRRITR
jgi:uncharacterized protein YbjT (DUF2867 family)